MGSRWLPGSVSPAEAIADESARLRLLVEAVEEYAILLLAIDGTVMTWNPAAEKLKGYSAQDIVGKHFSCLYTVDDARDGKPERELAIAAREGVFIDNGWRVRQDGSRFWAHVVITALYEGPILLGFAKVTRDDTSARAAAARGEAMQDITRSLLIGADPARVLGLVTRHARHLTGAGRTWLAVRQGSQLVVCAADGPLPGPQLGAVLPDEPLISSVFTKDSPARFVDDLRVDCPNYPGVEALGAGLLVPMVTSAGITGVLVAAAPAGASPFRASDLELLQSFSLQAELVLSYELAQEALRGKQLSDDRDRIARDLHDHVIQQLFATGMGLQRTATRSPDAGVRTSLEEAVDLLDATIHQIRTTIFELETPDHGARMSVRAAIMTVVSDAARALTFSPTLRLTGPIDSLIQPSVLGHLLAALREMLSNVARHAQASAVSVIVAVAETVTITVTDNGTGPPRDLAPGNGLRNLRARALALHGSFELEAASSQGSVACLTIPLPSLTGAQTATPSEPADHG